MTVQNRKYPLNRWSPAVQRVNGKLEQIWIYPYKEHGIMKYRIKKRDYKCHNSRQNDSASSNHSDFMKRIFDGEIASVGIDLPGLKTEIKETRQDKYYVQEKDNEAKQFLFYNHRNEQFKVVQKSDYEKIMGKLDHTQTPTQIEVEKMSGYETKDPDQVKKIIKKSI